MTHPYFDLATPLVIGHRGAAGERPENTLPSFARALEQGADILETDAHPTADGQVVLFHDDTLDRTTNGNGPVNAQTLSALRGLDAGFRFTPHGGAIGATPFRGHGVRIPTLDETLEAFPSARLNIELKENAPGFIERTLAILREHGREETTLLTAGEDPVMEALRAEVKASGSRVALGASIGDVLRFVRCAIDASAPPDAVMALQIPADFAGKPLVTAELLKHAHLHGIQIHVWTINDAPEMERLLALGVDGIVSDFPGRLAEVIARHDRGRTR